MKFGQNVRAVPNVERNQYLQPRGCKGVSAVKCEPGTSSQYRTSVTQAPDVINFQIYPYLYLGLYLRKKRQVPVVCDRLLSKERGGGSCNFNIQQSVDFQICIECKLNHIQRYRDKSVCVYTFLY